MPRVGRASPAWVPRYRPAGGWHGQRPGLWRPRTARPPALLGLPQSIELRTPAPTATIPAAGSSTLILAPDGGVTWYPHEATVWATPNPTYQVFVQIYQGGANGTPTSLLASTYAGSGDTLGLPGRAVRPGDALIAVFSQCPPGSVVSVRYEGVAHVLA